MSDNLPILHPKDPEAGLEKPERLLRRLRELGLLGEPFDLHGVAHDRPGGVAGWASAVLR